MRLVEPCSAKAFNQFWNLRGKQTVYTTEHNFNYRVTILSMTFCSILFLKRNYVVWSEGFDFEQK